MPISPETPSSKPDPDESDEEKNKFETPSKSKEDQRLESNKTEQSEGIKAQENGGPGQTLENVRDVLEKENPDLLDELDEQKADESNSGEDS